MVCEVSSSGQDGFALQHTNTACWEVHKEGCLHNLNQEPEGECATQWTHAGPEETLIVHAPAKVGNQSTEEVRS